jgi:hypothetical protein
MSEELLMVMPRAGTDSRSTLLPSRNSPEIIEYLSGNIRTIIPSRERGILGRKQPVVDPK